MRGQTSLSDLWFVFYEIFCETWVLEGENADGIGINADVIMIDDVTPTFLVLI